MKINCNKQNKDNCPKIKLKKEQMLNTLKNVGDGSTCSGKPWFYNEKVKDHFFHPRNIFKSYEDAAEFALQADGIGLVGSPACGDGMKMFVRVDRENDEVIECKYQTYGCGTAIASTSAFSEMITKNGGMKLEEALKISPKEIADYIGGIPPRKFHCSVLAHKAFREAVNDYFKKTGQNDRVKGEKVEVVDKVLKITNRDIEHAVLEGVFTFEDVQKKTKVGVHDKKCIPRVKELIEMYKKKFFDE